MATSAPTNFCTSAAEAERAMQAGCFQAVWDQLFSRSVEYAASAGSVTTTAPSSLLSCVHLAAPTVALMDADTAAADNDVPSPFSVTADWCHRPRAMAGMPSASATMATKGKDPLTGGVWVRPLGEADIVARSRALRYQDYKVCITKSMDSIRKLILLLT